VLSQAKNAVDSKPEEKLPTPDVPPTHDEDEDKDLSFLFEASIYHPLSQLEVPAPFRRPFPQLNVALTDSNKAFDEIESALSRCDILGAAHLSGGLLASGILKPTDQRRIFRALQIRYACLELSGNVLLAAQEVKALEDLGSAFYYVDLPQDEDPLETTTDKLLPRHIMPFSLRLQALRLQSIGFSDPRRGVTSLYDLALECREQITSSKTDEHRRLWGQRLEEVGIRVVNGLIEMGDPDCAHRTLASMRSTESTWAFRKCMLCLKMGLLGEARKLVESLEPEDPKKQLLESLIAVAEHRLDDAVTILTSSIPAADKEISALARQNAAVALLYRGEIQKARSLMETLVDEHESFSTLTINLATIHDLTSDRSRELKLTLVDKVAANDDPKQPRTFTNADFKL
jgi:trafficking protein particle complex subunit 12